MSRHVPLGSMLPRQFLAEYWQKKPLLIKKAYPQWQPLLSPDELAGLACEKTVESRLVLQRGNPPWQVLHGPFKASAFQRLPKSHWSLLVQGVDRLVPAVSDLLQDFSFIPNWRLDDIMISYAPDQGGVGPHVDQYDVFLIQGWGQREWQVGAGPIREEALLPDIDLRILKSFQPKHRWRLDPGDILYLPPRWAHNGIAIGDCMTYSVGFRAPSYGDILQGFMKNMIAALDADELRYEDPELRLRTHPGAITPQDMKKIAAILKMTTEDPQRLRTWFGCFVTEPKTFHQPPPKNRAASSTSLKDALQKQGLHLVRAEGLRTAFIDQKGDGFLLFVEGECFSLPKPWASLVYLLTENPMVTPELLGGLTKQQQVWSMLATFVNRGWWVISDDT